MWLHISCSRSYVTQGLIMFTIIWMFFSTYLHALRSLSYKRTSQYDTLTLFRAHNFTRKINKTKFHLIIIVFLCFLWVWKTFNIIFLILKWIIAKTQIYEKYFLVCNSKIFKLWSTLTVAFSRNLRRRKTDIPGKC